jgi:hypothetical protein
LLYFAPAAPVIVIFFVQYFFYARARAPHPPCTCIFYPLPVFHQIIKIAMRFTSSYTYIHGCKEGAASSSTAASRALLLLLALPLPLLLWLPRALPPLLRLRLLLRRRLVRALGAAGCCCCCCCCCTAAAIAATAASPATAAAAAASPRARCLQVRAFQLPHQRRRAL